MFHFLRITKKQLEERATITAGMKQTNFPHPFCGSRCQNEIHFMLMFKKIVRAETAALKCSDHFTKEFFSQCFPLPERKTKLIQHSTDHLLL